MKDLQSRLERAWERRAPVRADAETTAFRAVNAEADALSDITVDLFDKVAVLSLYRTFSEDEERRLGEAVAEVTKAQSVYLKRRPKEARVVANVARQEVAPPSPLWGAEDSSVVVKESGLSFLIRPGQGLPVGLYLDMREVRAWLRDEGHAKGKTVLNTFAFTCAFGVYAHAGGAARVVKKVQIMALTGKSEIDYTIDRILTNNAGMIPQPHP